MRIQFRNSRNVLAGVELLLVLLLGNCSVIFPVIAPFSHIPEPTGPYAVATRTTCWADSTRDETFTPEVDYRKIVVQVWYPVDANTPGTPISYIDNPELRLPAIAKQLRLPVSLIKHFNGVNTNSIVLETPANSGGSFPVLLFSHGLSGMRFQNTSLMEELASQGYIVFAADHSYEANITIFGNGDVAEYRAGKRRALNDNFINTIDLSQIHIVVEDLRFTLDRVLDDASDPFLNGVPQSNGRVGVVGHSLGGAAVINAMAVDQRVQAAMVLDGWYSPVPDSVIEQGLKKPIFHLGQSAWSTPGNYTRMDQMLRRSTGPIYKLLVPGTRHADYTDMPLFTPFSQLIGYTAVTNPEWLNSVIRNVSTCFFDVYLKGDDPEKLRQLMLAETRTSAYIRMP